VILTKIGYGLSGLIGGGIIFIGARFFAVPQAAAAGFGIPTDQDGGDGDPYLAAKGIRDIASGVVVFVLLASRRPHILGRFMIAASMIPIGDGINVLQHDGPKATAYGVHGATAAAMMATGALLLSGPA
jgi:hypothetical protein